MSEGAISRLESGERSPSIEVAVALANYFNVSTDYLLGISDYPWVIPANVQEILNQVSSPGELLEALANINQFTEAERPYLPSETGQGNVDELLKGLDEESMKELIKFLKYLHARQTLSPDNDESLAGLDINGNKNESTFKAKQEK